MQTIAPPTAQSETPWGGGRGCLIVIGLSPVFRASLSTATKEV
ncbi:MAG TPA: hypothetical protein P5551_06415 [Syntrophales bacterium]|nr:hypothetical protein [Syntrophales bacterium]HRT61977.1 hypothetical protein [Syntrophales bacterium]